MMRSGPQRARGSTEGGGEELMAASESECVRGLLAAVTDWVGDGRGRAEGGEGRQEEALYCAVLCCTVPLQQRKAVLDRVPQAALLR